MSVAPLSPPSPWFVARRDDVRTAAQLGAVLDLACGAGRHAFASAELGARVVALDRDGAALRGIAARARERGLAASIRPVRADLETKAPPPLRPAAFGAVLVFRYLHRPLCAFIAAALRPGGVLVYETFTEAQRALGHGPRSPSFLLEPGELPRLFPGLEVVAFEEGRFGGDRPEALARLVARRVG